MTLLNRYADHAYALMRIVTGLLFSFHGMQKIFGILSDFQPELWTQVWIGGMIELIGGLMIMTGLRTRIAAFICSGQMAVAYIQFHWKFQFDGNFFPPINQGELAVIYCFVFLYIATRGAVKWGFDKH